MSTTGTETGPFQSVEVSVVPRLARRPGRALGPITCWATPPPPSAPSPVPPLPPLGAYNLLGSSAALLLARQGLSQMDVPTRQAFMAEIFDEEEKGRSP